jgi:hypothetical protein
LTESHEPGETPSSRRSTRNRAGSRVLLACGLASVSSLVVLQFFPSTLQFVLPLIIAVALAITGIVVGVQRDVSAVSVAGVLALVAVVVLCGWIWGTQLALYPDDPVRGCIEGLGVHTDVSDLRFHRSVLPPGMFCLSTGTDNAWVLVTPAETVLAWSTVLGIVALTHIAPVLLARRAELRATS